MRKHKTGRFRFAVLTLLAAAAAATAYIGTLTSSRAGYTLDEEITAAVVPSISQHGVPMLPSGVVYLRGLPYTYFAWLAGTIAGQTLITYRVVSFGFAIAGLVTMFMVGRALGGVQAGIIGAILLMGVPAFVAASGFARPYSPFVFTVLLALLSFHNFYVGRLRPSWFVLLLVLGRLLHEFGTIVALIPLVYAIAGHSDADRRRGALSLWPFSILAIAAVELAVHTGVQHSLGQRFIIGPGEPDLFAVRLPPFPSIDVVSAGTPFSIAQVALAFVGVATMVGRLTGVWFVTVVCTVLGMLFQLGGIPAFMTLAVLARPQRLKPYAIVGVSIWLASVALWSVHTLLRTGSVPTWSFVSSLITGHSHYPLAGFRYLWLNFPLTAAAAGCVVVWLVRVDRRGDDTDELRALMLLAALGLLTLGVLGIDIKPRFFLLVYPLLIVVCALGLQALYRMGHLLARTTVVLLLTGLVAGQYVYGRFDLLKRVRPMPTIESADVLICNEELACRYLFGRVDYLLATTDSDRSQYTGRTASGLRGLYAYSPALADVSQIEDIIHKTARRTRYVLVLLKTGKVEYDDNAAVAEELRKRYGGYSWSGTDVMILFLPAEGASAVRAQPCYSPAEAIGRG